MEITLDELAELVDGTVIRGELDFVLTGFASLSDASSGDLCFYNNKAYFHELRVSLAGAVLVAPDFILEEAGDTTCAFVQVEDPTLAFGKVLAKFGPREPEFKPGIHASAAIAESARFDRDQVCIGANAVIEDDVQLGIRSEIGAGSVIGRGASVGEDCRIGPNVTVYGCCRIGSRVVLHGGVVLGADGFGFEVIDGKRTKVPQLGTVQIDDDVEIGANSAVDRGRFGRTWIKEGTKIDNLIQVGHNAVIGKHCVIAALTGIAGSATIEDDVTIAAQSGIGGHIRVGRGAVLGGRSGVNANLEGGAAYIGFPARPMKEGRRAMVLFGRLPEIVKRLRKLEDKARDQ